MGSKRGKGEGTIYWREDRQCWASAVNLGWVDGKRKRKVVYGKTRKEVAEKLKTLLHDQQQGVPVITRQQTLGQLLDTWLTEKVKLKNRPKTYDSYSQMARLHIQPTLGKIPLDKLSAQDIDTLLNRKRAKLAPRSVQYIRAVIRMALVQALKWGLVSRNVATLTEPIKVEPYHTTPLNLAQAQLLLKAAQGDRLEALYRVALSLGLREGEALGLRWEDVDFDKRTLQVRMALQSAGGKLVLAAPKTATSRRELSLPAALLSALKAHHTRQLAERLKRGAAWQDHGLVFPSNVGTPMSPRNLLRAFKFLLERAGLPKIRFHDLRHSCASLLIAQGVDAIVVRDVLGHADIRTTLNVYAHVFDEAKRHAADVMDLLLPEENVAV